MSLCWSLVVFPHRAQSPPGLRSVPRLCSPAPVPQRPPSAMFDRRPQPPRAGPGGAQGLTTHAPNSRDLSLSSCSSWPHSQFSDPGYLSLAAEFCWGVSWCQLSNSKGITPLHSQQISPSYGGGSEPAENHVPVSHHWRINSGLNIIQAQSP